jgi:hypothetical protein
MVAAWLAAGLLCALPSSAPGVAAPTLSPGTPTDNPLSPGAPLPPLDLLRVTPDAQLRALFASNHGWTGADGAHSVRLDAQRVLWWFGDTFVGEVQGNQRPRSTPLINNTGGLQQASTMRFFWGAAHGAPAAWLTPAEHDGSWYWPGDMLCDAQGLALFALRLASTPITPSTPEGFNFRELDPELLLVADPRGEPSSWRVVRRPLPVQPRLGAACTAEGPYLYAYGLLPEDTRRGLDRPLAVARLARRQLATAQAREWKVWQHDGTWADAPPPGQADALKKVGVLFRDAAPELSVTRVAGLPGLVAVYTPYGLSSTIMLRWAPRPEGPWSAPLRLYTCPEGAQGLLTYAARAHPELASQEGELVITYCCNTRRADEHYRDASIYRPRTLRVLLRFAHAARAAQVRARCACCSSSRTLRMLLKFAHAAHAAQVRAHI